MAISMTGFGRGETVDNERQLTIEIKSVNHRYCDVKVRLPRQMMFMENAIIQTIKQEVKRGKVDVFINYSNFSKKELDLKYNASLAKEYLKYFRQMSDHFLVENDITIPVLARFPDVFKLEEQDDDEDLLKNMVLSTLDQAMIQLIQARQLEGQELKNDLMDKLKAMSNFVDQLEAIGPQVVEEYKVKLENRINELLEDTLIDQDRLALEAAVFADKSCIDEEIVRLRSHVTHMMDTLNKEGAVGRKLDFLAQEMNREANTILSKANHARVANQGIELKTLVEKIREQIQNIE